MPKSWDPADISTEDILKEYERMSRLDMDQLYQELENALGSLGYLGMEGAEAPEYKGTERGLAAIQFGLPPSSWLRKGAFLNIQQWICENGPKILMILESLQSNTDKVKDLVNLIKKGVGGVIGLTINTTPVARVILAIVIIILKYGLEVFCKTDA